MAFAPAPREGGGLPQALLLRGAGTAAADGVYKATDELYCDAPVYVHVGDTTLKVTREPHTTKSGALKHGWLLGQNKAPLYGAPTEALSVPAAGWKRFGGEAPVPEVVVYERFADVFFAQADEAKAAGDAAGEREDWAAALDAFTEGIEALKRSGERFGEAFRDRAALLLARRAAANAKAQDFRAALRDAAAALELVRSLASAEAAASEAARALGCADDALLRRVLDVLGNGRVLDAGAPLVLRCVERWVGELAQLFEAGDASAPLPEPRHLPSDRYLEHLPDADREEVLRRHMPEWFQTPGGTGIIKDPADCLVVMQKWEEVFAGADFQERRKELWNRRDLNYPMRLQETKKMICTCVADILEPMGFAPGQPGLTRCIRQMQVYWSQDKACACKALDLEELADVSLADLQ